jgi:hypothetical protein
MIPNLDFIDLDDLAHRLLVTHRFPFCLEEAINPESAKDSARYPPPIALAHFFGFTKQPVACGRRTRWLGRQDSDPGMAESKSARLHPGAGGPLPDPATNCWLVSIVPLPPERRARPSFEPS